MFMTKLQVVGALVIAAATVGVGAGAIRQNGAVPVSRKEAQETRPAPVDNKARSALVEVPSLRGGQILFIATEVADPNQSVRVEDRKLYFQKRVPFIARLVRQGEKIPDGEKIGVRSEGDITVYSIRPKPHELPIDFFEVKQGKDTKLYRRVQKAEELQPNRVIVGLETKWFRNLRPGDAVRRDQLLAVLDTTSAFDEVAIRVKKFNGKEADRIASEKTRDEAQARLRTIERLRRNGVNIAEEEYRQNKLTYERYFHDELSKKAEVQIAELELARNLNALRQHEIRSPSDGVIKTILKHPGEAVKALETILRIEPSEEP